MIGRLQVCSPLSTFRYYNNLYLPVSPLHPFSVLELTWKHLHFDVRMCIKGRVNIKQYKASYRKKNMADKTLFKLSIFTNLLEIPIRPYNIEVLSIRGKQAKEYMGPKPCWALLNWFSHKTYFCFLAKNILFSKKNCYLVDR